ncbi:TPA: hypothetical protein ACWMH1_001576 [Pseudomonas aeruginosa]
MKERPILFTGPMVRAILEGRKTVTRRVVSPQPDFLGSMVDPNTPFKTLDAGLHARITCPYGEPGDRLWVREAWAADAQVDAIAPSDLSQGEPIWYPADLSVRQTGCSMISKGRVRPSIHMPRWASRILLEITAVRVERLHDLSDPDVLAEGCSHSEMQSGDSLVSVLARLWQSTGGDWAANPWVWVVEFKRVTP